MRDRYQTLSLTVMCACALPRSWLLVLLEAVAALTFGDPVLARGSETCLGAGDAPTPTEVTVTAVPIVVSSTTDDVAELNALGTMNPVNPADDIGLANGTVAVPDQATFDSLATDTDGFATVNFTL